MFYIITPSIEELFFVYNQMNFYFSYLKSKLEKIRGHKVVQVMLHIFYLLLLLHGVADSIRWCFTGIGNNTELMNIGNNTELMYIGNNTELMYIGYHTELMYIGFHTELMYIGYHTELMYIGYHTELIYIGYHTELMYIGYHTELMYISYHTELMYIGYHTELMYISYHIELMYIGYHTELIHLRKISGQQKNSSAILIFCIKTVKTFFIKLKKHCDLLHVQFVCLTKQFQNYNNYFGKNLKFF